MSRIAEKCRKAVEVMQYVAGIGCPCTVATGMPVPACEICGGRGEILADAHDDRVVAGVLAGIVSAVATERAAGNDIAVGELLDWAHAYVQRVTDVQLRHIGGPAVVDARIDAACAAMERDHPECLTRGDLADLLGEKDFN